jgi:hypothetical protein
MRECWQQWKEADYWKVRRCPKSNRTPPVSIIIRSFSAMIRVENECSYDYQETISKEWDKVDLSHPGPVSRFTGESFDPQHNEVAGRYGTWTNIFTIAKIVNNPISLFTISYCAVSR